MKYLIVGLGNIGQKRQRILGGACIATADPFQPEATYRSHLDVPLKDFDAAILATPTSVKIEYLTYFLKAGKHVLVEKPLIFPDLETASEFQTTAGRSGAIWYTSYNHRFEPHIMGIKSLIVDGAIGSIYKAHLLYGNGAVQNCIGTWRDEGHGMLDELACHLIDLTSFLFGYQGHDYHVIDLRPVESRNFDYGLLATSDRRITLEFGSIFWKNTFSIDVIGETGSLHMNGLGKWGSSDLTVRRRVYPSGVPIETRKVLVQPDTTWEADIRHFESLVELGQTSLESDIRISNAISTIAAAYDHRENAEAYR